MKHMVKFTALVCCLLAAASLFADPATGWKQTAGGEYDYNDTANWVGGDVNGIFGSDLTLEGAQTITFAADTSLTNGLTIAYAGDYAMTFTSSDDSAKTLTLGGDITSSMSGSSAAVVTFDSSLAIDLDNSGRTITASSANGVLDIKAAIASGSLTIAGDKTLKLAGANTYAGGTTIAGSTYVYVNSATAFGTGDVSINAVLNLCADNNLTMTANNKFYMNAERFAYRSGKTLDIGTGDFVATNSFQFWAEGDSLTIHGRIVDKDGVPSPWKLKKWGSRKLVTYSEWVANGETLEFGNGTWDFYGEISGQNPTVVGTNNTTPLNLYGQNSFDGIMDVSGGNVSVWLRNETAIPDGAKVKVASPASVVGVSQKANALLSGGKIDKDSTGMLALSSNETANFDLSACPALTLGASGNNCTLTGVVTTSAGSVLRLGGGGKSLTLNSENAIAGNGVVEVYGNNVILTQTNDFCGTVRIMKGNCLELKGDLGTLPNADVQVMGGTFFINSDSGVGCKRAGTVHLHGGFLQYSGNGMTSTYDTIDKLIVDVRDPQYGIIGGVCHIRLYANGKTAKFHVGEFVRNNDMVWRMTGNAANNKLRIGGADGDNTVQFTVGNSAEILGQLVGGGGAAGTTTISIYPFGFADCGTYYDSLLTYGSTGFRALDYETEYATSITPGTASQDNVRLPVGTACEITSDTVVNSLFMQGHKDNKGTTRIYGNGTLKLTSGVLVMGYHSSNHPDVDSPVDFGNRQGIVCFARGKGSNWRGALHGESGAIFFQTSDSAGTHSGGTGLQMLNDATSTLAQSTITGNIIVHGNISVAAKGVFPGPGDRLGNMHVYGFMSAAGTFNAVNGTGAFYRTNDLIEIGAHNSDGDTEGELDTSKSDSDSNSTRLTKIGTGRQRIGGISEHTGATTVSAGTLQVDGAFTQSAVTVAEGATLAGCGTFGGAVTLAAGAKLEAGSKKVEDQVMNLDGGLTLAGDATLNLVYKDNLTVGGITLGGALPEGKKITVNVVLGAGEKLKSKQHVIVESTVQLDIANFKRGENCGNLKLSADGKQLLMTVQSGLALYIR